MTDKPFALEQFLPYLLNLAAEECGRGFQAVYKSRYGMLRTEWRVLFHLGLHGEMTARDISMRARTHKTKISRAVAALELKRFLKRDRSTRDRRHEVLRLTSAGEAAFDDLSATASAFDAKLVARLAPDHASILRECLTNLIETSA
ncbi:MAG: MarR family transcriptional regulator [Pseudomonadota bacterium]